MTTLMKQNPAMRGEKIYECDLIITSVTDYGLSMDDEMEQGRLVRLTTMPLPGSRHPGTTSTARRIRSLASPEPSATWRFSRSRTTLLYLVMVVGMWVGVAHSQVSKYPPLEQYLMPQADEIALAKTAAPTNISDHATIKVLTKSGFEVAHKGDNGSVCMVMRGFSAPTYSPAQFRNLVYDPTVRAPICFTPASVRTVMPYYELRTKLALQGKNPDEIAEGVAAAYAKGELPKRDEVTFAYMWSARQNLAPGIGHWHPHMMVFVPYYDNSMVGGNPFGSPLPQLTDDAGTPFSVIVIPVDDKLAVGGEMK